jgi:hypothetical protein
MTILPARARPVALQKQVKSRGIHCRSERPGAFFANPDRDTIPVGCQALGPTPQVRPCPYSVRTTVGESRPAIRCR